MASISGWFEGVILTLAVVLILGVVIVQMDVKYGKDYLLPFNDNQNTRASLSKFINDSDDMLSKGQAQTSIFGISLTSSWGIAYSALTIGWKFLIGDWISQLISAWNIGEAGSILAIFLRVLWVGSIVFSALYIFFKVPP